jgi:phospholipid/cholesterol/gamma-HCH transport system ATP-binding protein
MSDVINDLIRTSVSDLGATALSITHDMGSVRKIADRVAMLHEGRIIWEGPVAEMEQSGSAHVDQFINGKGHGPIKVVA